MQTLQQKTRKICHIYHARYSQLTALRLKIQSVCVSGSLARIARIAAAAIGICAPFHHNSRAPDLEKSGVRHNCERSI